MWDPSHSYHGLPTADTNKDPMSEHLRWPSVSHTKQTISWSRRERDRILAATISWQQPPPVIEGSPTLYNNAAGDALTMAALSSTPDTVGPRARRYCHRGLNVHHSDTSEVPAVGSKIMTKCDNGFTAHISVSCLQIQRREKKSSFIQVSFQNSSLFILLLRHFKSMVYIILQNQL